jgi:capsid portal protein
METYNGWSNYETWRIALEVFDGYDGEEKVTAEYLREIAEEVIFNNVNNNLAVGLLTTFLNDVNFHEIAENINNNY